MTRRHVSWLACALLLVLTFVTWHLTERNPSAWTVAGLALLKISVIGAVFLELDRSRRRWALAFVLYFTIVLSTAGWLISG